MRELGDWGVFLTPEAQCLGEKTTEYEIIPHGAGEELYHSYEEAYQFQTDWQTAGMERQAAVSYTHLDVYKRQVRKRPVTERRE